MATSTFSGNPYINWVQERDVIAIPPSLYPVIDKNWKWTDAAGHLHTGANFYATVREVTEPCNCDRVDEPHDVFVEWRCSQCDEIVKPATRVETQETYMPGAVYTYVEVTIPGGEWRSYTITSPDTFEATREITDPNELCAALDADDRAIMTQRNFTRQ